MRNLLTPSFKRTLKQEYFLRITVVSGWMLALAMVIGVLALLPAYFLSRTNLNTLSAEYGILQASVASLKSDASAAPLTILKQRLEVLATEKEEKRLTEAILAVLAHRATPVTVTSFDYAKGTTVTTLKLRGVAMDRASLLTFERALKNDGRFSKVELPVANLARERDIKFEIILPGDF